MALPARLLLEIVTPDRALVREEVDEVQLPGYAGYFGVLPGHTPLLAPLKVGELWYRIGQEKHHLAIAGGFVEVLPERVTVLAQIAERAQDIDVARAEAARQRAEERLARLSQDVDPDRARLAQTKALVRLQVAALHTRMGRDRGHG
jgi:F-type H+-transporting ATPase subunit epsilon